MVVDNNKGIKPRKLEKFYNPGQSINRMKCYFYNAIKISRKPFIQCLESTYCVPGPCQTLEI